LSRVIKTAMAEPDSLKLPIDETTPLLQPPANPPYNASAQSDALGHGGDVDPEVEERLGGENTEGGGDSSSVERAISPKIAVAILTIGKSSGFPFSSVVWE
jgi:hypothetical protein